MSGENIYVFILINFLRQNALHYDKIFILLYKQPEIGEY